MSIYELKIDPSSAESGAARIVKSFDSILAASRRMEGGVSASAQKMLASFTKLSNVRTISREAISQLNSLSASLSSFRGPSKAAVDNTSRFLTFLRNLGRITLPSGSSMAAFLAAMTGYRGPSANAGRNTQALLRALSSFTPPAGVGSRVTSFLAALAGFRGPSANAGRNTASLLRALSSFSGTPRNLSAAIRQFQSLAAAIDSAARSMSSFRRVSIPNIRIPTVSGGRGGFSPRQYGQDLGYMHNALIRTNTALNALGGILAARSIINASNSIIAIRAQLQAATGSVQQARVQFAFLRRTASELGLEFTTLADSYGFFLGSIRGTNVTMENARQIFRGFSVAARALQLSTSDVNGIFRALGQIMSKGRLQAEELRQQLGDRLPGAFVRMARALNLVRPGELDAALKRGTISGDRLTAGLLRMAQTLEQEFTPSAVQMSRTVDAAFNRLKNSFTFAAAGLGASGLNQGIIDITDGLRRLLESQGVANLLRLIGTLFRFVGENANFFAAIVGGIALSATLRWIVTLRTFAAIWATIQGLSIAATIGNIAMASGTAATYLTRATGATLLFTRAWAVLAVMIRAHPFFFIAAAITGLILVVNQLSESQAALRRASAEMNEVTADGTNLTQAYTERAMDLTGVVNAQTNAFRENTLARIENALQSGRESTFNIRGSGDRDTFSLDSPRSTIGTLLRATGLRNAPISQRAMRDLRGVAYQDSSGRWRLRSFPATRQGFQQRNLATSQLSAMVGEQGYTNENDRRVLTEVASTAEGVRNALISRSRMPGYRGPNYAQWAQEDWGDYNREALGEGLSGAPVDRPDRSGAGAARAYAQDIRRAQEALRDLRREASASHAEVNAALGTASELADTQANAASDAERVQSSQARFRAEATVNNFMDSFRDTATAERGIIDLNQQMRNQITILEQMSPAAQAARTSLIEFLQAEELIAAQRARSAEVAGNVVTLRQENLLRQDMVEATRQGGQALQAANIEYEVQKQLIGVAAEDAERLERALRGQLQRQLEINRALAIAEADRHDLVEVANSAGMASRYNDGYTQSELDYYRELVELRSRLIDDGYTESEINHRLRVRQATQQQIEIERQLQNQYQRSAQLAQDQADAIVDGFREGIRNGQSFLSMMKSIFNSLRDILLDFVLYNPLREFLTQAFTRSNAKSYVSGDLVNSSISTAQSLIPLFTGGYGSSSASAGMGGPLQAPGGSIRAAAGAEALSSITQAGESMTDSTDIVVAGVRETSQGINQLVQTQSSPRYFDNLRAIFDYRTNFQSLGKVFSGGFKDLGKTLPGAIGAAGGAFAAYSMGKGLGQGVAKALGFGKGTSHVVGDVVGGAAAGYSLGGPIGAGIGAILGLGKGLLTMPKTPSSFGSVTVGATGRALGGAGGRYGGGNTIAGKEMAAAGASIFNDFANNFNAMLKAGNYGTFGKRDFKGDGIGEVSFYSTSGQLKKGKPIGQEGVDWIKGSDSEVQAFALKTAINAGKIEGLSQSILTVAKNTLSTTIEGLQADFQVAQQYDEFIKGSFRTSDLKKQVDDLNDAWKKLSRQAAQLGLSEAKLKAARDRMLETMRQEFNFSVSQGILGITDPIMAAYNDLVKEYRDTVSDAIAVGGDLTAVERYYGLKRAELIKQYMEEANDSIRAAARDLLISLTASQNSPLSNSTILRNAQGNFRNLAGQITSGNFSNVGNVGEYATNYLEAARTQYASSADYFTIFTEVTDFLRALSTTMDIGTSGSTDPEDLPQLPNLQALVDEITAANAEIALVTGQVGAAVVETGAETNEHLLNIEGLLREGFGIREGMPSGGLGGGGGAGHGALRTVAETVDLF